MARRERDASAQAGTKQDDDDAPRKSRHWTRGYATRMRLARVGSGHSRRPDARAQADSCCASENGSCLIWGWGAWWDGHGGWLESRARRGRSSCSALVNPTRCPAAPDAQSSGVRSLYCTYSLLRSGRPPCGDKGPRRRRWPLIIPREESFGGGRDNWRHMEGRPAGGGQQRTVGLE